MSQPTISNAAFLAALLPGGLPQGEDYWTCAFRVFPEPGEQSPWYGTRGKISEDGRANTYFSISTLRRPPPMPEEERARRAQLKAAGGKVQPWDGRRREFFGGLFLVPLDDVEGELPIPPSYVLETSPGRRQVGYRLDPVLRDAHLAERLMNELVRTKRVGKVDSGGSNHVRYVRLPVGSNTKPKYGTPPRHRLLEWYPERAYSAEQLVQAFGLDLDSVAGERALARVTLPPPVAFRRGSAVIAELQRRHFYKAALGTGKHDVTCPWVREHTDARDGGTCYWEPDAERPRGGFKCQHGHCAGRNVGDLLAFLGMAPTKEEKGKSQATRIIELLEAAGVSLFHDPEGDAYAHLPGGATWPTRSRPFKAYLAKVVYSAEASVVGGQALEDALRLLEAKGLHDGEEVQVPVRVAHHRGAVYLDLGDPTWRAIEVRAEGWRVLPGAELPVRFRRPKGALSLPVPERGGKLADLREHINVPDDEAWTLLAGFTVAAIVLPRGPFPILGLQGEHGAAKTTSSNRIAALLDPRISGLRALPHSLEVLAVGAHNSFLLGFDNVSRLEPWLSDALCRISTGSGFATRQHYENKEEAIFEAARPVLLNGIESAATRGDLIDRTVVVELPRLPEKQRLTQREADRRFEAARPRILAGLLDAVALALRNRDSVRLPAKPRMADFAEVAVAAEQAFGVSAGTFLAGYEVARSEGAETAVEASPVAGAVIKFMKDKSFWEGSASESLEALSRPEDARGWPRSANEMASQLKRAAPHLRKFGIEVAKPPRSSRGRRWWFRKGPPDALRGEREPTASCEGVTRYSCDHPELAPVTPMTPSPAILLARLHQEPAP